MPLDDQSNSNLKGIVEELKAAQRLLFITGAGISADSGVPTYRGVSGLYSNANPEEGIPIEEILSGSMIQKKPQLTWKYLGQIEQACRGASPNQAHKVIAAMEEHFEVCVFTQNVDGFHYQAGSKNIIDIHGDVHYLYCTECKWKTRVEDYSNVKLPPACPECTAWARPDVVLFGEMLDMKKMLRLEAETSEGFDLVFSIGTSSMFPYILQPVIQAKKMGISTVEINPGETDLSSFVKYKISGGAAESMSAIWEGYLAENLN